MSSEWFYTLDGKSKYGPVSTGQLQALAKSGQLKPTDMVWKESMAKWVPASKMKGLFSSSPSVTATPFQLAASAMPASPATPLAILPKTDPNTVTAMPPIPAVSPSTAQDPADKKSIVQGIGGLVVIGIVLIGYLGGCSGKITKSNYDKITNGMTEAEVEAILDKGEEMGSSGMNMPGKTISVGNRTIDVPGVSSSSKTIIWKRWTGSNIIITFSDGRVLAKAQAGL